MCLAILNIRLNFDEQVKIHRTCPGELDDVVKLLEKATGSVVIDQIGRTTILYRPSLTKLKAEEKKKKVLEAFKGRKQKMKQAVLVKKQLGEQSACWKFLSKGFFFLSLVIYLRKLILAIAKPV